MHRLNLAKAYRSLGYPDLAIGDAYKALLLVDEVAEKGEYHDEALEAAYADYLSAGVVGLTIDPTNGAQNDEDDKTVIWAQMHLSRTAYVREGLEWFFLSRHLLTQQGMKSS